MARASGCRGCGTSSPAAATTTPRSPSTSPGCRRPSTTSSSGIGDAPREGTVTFKRRPRRRRVRRAGSRGLPRRDPGPARAAVPARRLAEAAHRGEAARVTDDEVRQALEEFGKPAMSGPVTLVLAGHKVVAPPRLFAAGLSMEAVDGKLVPRVDGELLLEALAPGDAHDRREPEDARFVVRHGKPRVVPAKVGVEVDPARDRGPVRRRRRTTGERDAGSPCGARPPSSPTSPPPRPGR